MPEKAASPRWMIVLAFAALYVIWGSTYLSIRIAIETIPPFLMVAMRFLIASGIMFALARASGASLPTRIEWRSAGIMGVLLLVGGNGGVSWSEQKLPSGLAALLVAMVPLWVALIEWFRPGGRRPADRAFVGIALGLAGLLVLVSPDLLANSQQIDPLSVFAIILATILWATGTVYSRTDYAKLPPSPLMSTAVEMLIAGVVLALLALATGEMGRFHPAGISSRSLIAVGYLVVFGSAVAFTAFVWLLQVVPATRVATYAYVNPVVAVVLGWLILGERLTIEMQIATPIIILAVILITTAQPAAKAKQAVEPEAPALEVTLKPSDAVAANQK